MSQHGVEFVTDDATKWDIARCLCGWQSEPSALSDSAEAYADHRVAMAIDWVIADA